MTVYDIIKKPVITEKSEGLRREFNKFTFEVDKRANKIQIGKAVETMFKVKVLNVATSNAKSVSARHGQKLYMTKTKKKAVVTLAQGNTITYFESV